MLFEQRCNSEVMNLLFSYSGIEDKVAVSKGFTFLGAGHDEHGNEVHVFQMTALLIPECSAGVTQPEITYHIKD
jgi:hypothetical protein